MSLCSPPETLSPLQLTLPERQRSQELLPTSSKKICVSTCTKESCCESSAPAKFPGIPWNESPEEPAMDRLRRRQLQGMSSRNQAPALTCLSLLLSLSQLLWPNRFWNLPISELHRLIRHCTFPLGCLGFH